MPKFLEEKLKREYPNNPSAVYGTMNNIGAMHGNKETEKGREMEKKHERGQEKKPRKKAKISGRKASGMNWRNRWGQRKVG